MPDDSETSAPGSTDTADKQDPKAGRRPAEAASKSPRLLITVAAVLVLVIAALGGVVWYRSSGSSDSSGFSDQEAADAKKAVCAASAKVQRSVVLNTHLQNPNADDRVGALAVMANARLALTAGGAYLHDVLDAHPAAPQDLTDTVNTWSTTLEALGVSYLAGERNDAREPLQKDLATQFKRVGELCK